MNEDIKEILDIEKYRNKDGYVENINLLPSEIHKLKDYITNLQSNWNSLREWLMQLKNSYMETDNIFDDAKFRILLTVLDKMNELEGKDMK